MDSSLERPVLAVDVVVLRVNEGRLEVLLHRRGAQPFRGQQALPGVAVQADETLESASRRALAEKGQVPVEEQDRGRLYLEQLATFDALFRDPRGRTVSVAYLGLTRPGALAARGWRPVPEIPRGSLPFDHDQVLEAAVERLRGKLRYTNIATHLLPPLFRIEELEEVYSAVLGRRPNRANFRTKLLRLGLIERAGILDDAIGAQGGRPPHLYRFASSRTEAASRDFL